MWIPNHFSVPNSIVDEHLSDLSECELKLALLIMRHWTLPISTDLEDISVAMGFSVAEVQSAAKGLLENGLVRTHESPNGAILEINYEEDPVPPPYDFSECSVFSPVLTAEQEALPWGKWAWDSALEEFKRECRVPDGLTSITVGLPFSPHHFFSNGTVIVHQSAKRKNGYKSKPRRDVAAMTIERLGYTPERWVCVYCQREGVPDKDPDGRSWHVDHIYPRVHNGDNKPDNLVLACAGCNLSKGSKTAIEYVRKISQGANVQ